MSFSSGSHSVKDGLRIRRDHCQHSATFIDIVVENNEALLIPMSELEDFVKRDRQHNTEKQSSSGEVTECDSDGSDFDSDCDDEEISSIEATASLQVVRDIPDDAALVAPVRDVLEAVERCMDDEADRLLGMSRNFTWHEDFESFRGVPEKFSGPDPGPVKDYNSVYDAFVDIWDKDIIDCIVRETNRYAQQTIEELNVKGTLRRSSRLRNWEPTNADEIMILFAIFQFMAIVKCTSQAEYWKKGGLGITLFRRIMSYNRFNLLNKFLHFVDNSNPSRDMPQSGAMGSTKVLSRKLLKLAPIISHLGYKFDSLYKLKCHLSIDDSLTLFKGRLSWDQRIRSETARSGIKSYELCESDTGYMARFQIFIGKTDEALSDIDISADLGLKSTKIVLELLQGFEYRGHCITMDNFYNCPSLARYLKSKGFDCLGTLRANRRYVPNEITKLSAKAPKGTIISRHSGDVSIVSWKDSKIVNIISTYHTAGTVVVLRAGKKSVRPACVRDYNKYMRGIAQKNQILSTYFLERKRGIKWYVKLFKRLMNVSIMNSFIMYSCSRERRGQSPMMHRDLRYALAESLIDKHCSSQKQFQAPVGRMTRLRRDIVHDPSYHPGSNKKKRCRVCFLKNNKTKKSHLRCVPCDVFLCVGNCWKEWHTLDELQTQEASKEC